MNLISNSFKFTYSGRITVNISENKSYHFFQKARILEISVEDTGIGISSMDKANLFKVFGMVRKHRAEFNMKGSGLGLTIWEKLVRQMGGDIILNSQEGKGTEVIFTIMEKYSDENEDQEIKLKNIEDEDISEDGENEMLGSSSTLTNQHKELPNFRKCKFFSSEL